MIDADGSGGISPEEHRQFFEAFGIDTELSPSVFERLDTDGDGFVSQEEFLEAGAEFLLRRGGRSRQPFLGAGRGLLLSGGLMGSRATTVGASTLRQLHH